MSNKYDSQTQPTCFVESLNDIFLRNRPSQADIWPDIGGIEKSSIVMVKGNSGSGKSMFLMQLMARALMGATEMEVLLIDAEKSFKIFHFVEMCSELLEANLNDTVTHQNEIRKKLDQLHVSFPSENDFDSTIADLDKILSNETRISMVLVDSLGLFFYSDCNKLKDSSKEVIIASYLEKFKHLSKKYGVAFVYTLPNYIDLLDYRDNITTLVITLTKLPTGNFLMKTKSKEQEEKTLMFTIERAGIKILNASQV